MRNQNGFSLMELMISLAIVGSMFAGVSMLVQRGDDSTQGRNNADGKNTFTQLAVKYFNANRTNIEAAMGGDATQAAIYCRINEASDGSTYTLATNSTKHTCAFDTTHLVAQKMWPSGAAINVNGVGREVAIVRQVLSGSTPTGNDEMLVVVGALSNGNLMTSGTAPFTGTLPSFSAQAKAALASLGGMGGYIPPGTDFANCKYNATTKQACGNAWAVDLSLFIN